MRAQITAGVEQDFSKTRHSFTPMALAVVSRSRSVGVVVYARYRLLRFSQPGEAKSSGASLRLTTSVGSACAVHPNRRAIRNSEPIGETSQAKPGLNYYVGSIASDIYRIN